MGMKRTANRIEKDMDPVKAASQMDTDEIICLDELRDWLCLLAECSYQSIGHRRIKNPRIWSVHDLNILSNATTAENEVEQTYQPVSTEKKEGSTAIQASMPGSFWSRPSPDSPPFVLVREVLCLGSLPRPPVRNCFWP